ncbi:nuclear transport factor 2 family protein [Gordonia phthalatica]|uniref:Polyketide cyclase n=1 Tax=Gordonia phthalatica TaxID=1136941 RepID=A0A0N9N662_9ACTN|nr:nuclear transport factor 2 family protein [Gordonia phthalatica]ALG83241.1 polyketide cyclase [Gordonia phthalatica]
MTPSQTMPPVIEEWHRLIAEPDAARLRGLIAPGAVFKSPAVHTPQEGGDVTFAYLWAALGVLGPTLTYRRQWYAEDSAVLQFTAEVDGLSLEGVDIITWNDAGLIVDFTVIVRPYKGLQALIAAMGAALQSGG